MIVACSPMAENAFPVGCDSLMQIKQHDSLYSLSALAPLSTKAISTHHYLSTQYKLIIIIYGEYIIKYKEMVRKNT